MNDKARLHFLVEVVQQEIKHLQYSDKKVFASKFTEQKANKLSTDEQLAEAVEAFGSRFGRLQDTVGDKLLPVWLKAIGEKTSAVIDNLTKAEKLGVIESSERWMEVRALRNKIVHEYIKDFRILADALQSAHEQVEFIQQCAENIIKDINQRKL